MAFLLFWFGFLGLFVLFNFSETPFLFVAMAVLQLTLQIRLISNSYRSTWLCLQSTWIKSVLHHTQLGLVRRMGLFWSSEGDAVHSGFYNVLTVSKGFCRDFQPVGSICGSAKNFKRRYNTKRDNTKIAEGVIRGCIESHVSFSFPFPLLSPYLSLLPSSLFLSLIFSFPSSISLYPSFPLLPYFLCLSSITL